jgi:hypothetical protein
MLLLGPPGVGVGARVLAELDGLGSVEEVARRIEEALR